jgi:UDP-GlcNAc:undecaprenyl-phosphate/decaprenyl-phosphate GlcNAc-1-phosphate transferase
VTLALPFLLALLLSAILVPVCRSVAFRLGYALDRSQPGTKPKALFGGVALALALFGSAATVGVIGAVPVLLSCSAILFAVGLASDLFTLKPYTKLVAILAVASVFLVFDYRLYWAESVILDSLVTLFWIVAVTSAFNLLDNMDGLCAGITLIAGTAFLFTIAPIPPDGPLLLEAQYLVTLLGAVAGFLIYNSHPASIAMGESGSLMLGLNMAAMTLQIAPGRGSDLLSIIAVPVLLLLIPIVDAALVATRRLTARPADSHALPDHSSHQLVAMGLSERAAVHLLWVLSAISGAIGVAAGQSWQGIADVIAAMFTISMILFAVYLARLRVHNAAKPGGVAAVMPLGLASGSRRRLVEVLLDLLLISVAYYGAFRLRFDAAGWVSNFVFFRQSFPIVLGIQLLALLGVGAYRGAWRYFSLSDGVTFVKAVFLGMISAQAAILYLYRFEGYSPAIFIVYGMFLLLLLSGSRASFRLLSEFIQRQRSTGRRLLIYGAGDAGSIAVRHLLNDAGYAYRIIGFIDEDIRKHNMRVHGYGVIGGYDHLVGMIMSDQVDAVAITQETPSTQSLAALCAMYGVSLHRLTMDFHDMSVAEPKVGAAGMRRAEARVGPMTEQRLYPEPDGRSRGRTGGTRSSEPDPILQEHALEANIQPIRVAHVITRLILGGAQENTLSSAIGQHCDPRFDVTLVCGVDEAGEGNMFAEATQAGVKTVVIPSLVREIRPLSDARAFFELRKFFRRGAFTVVHTHSSKAGIIGRLAARAAGVPIVVHTLHGLVFHEFQSAWKNWFYIVLKRACAPLTDRIISVSDLTGKAALARRIGRPDQHITIYSGIDVERFLSVGQRLSVEEAKRRAGIPPEVPVVGKIARLFPLKGHEQFLAAATEIARRLPDVRFLLVGDGPLSEWLRQETERLGLADRVVMAGRVPPEIVPEYIQAMDVVVHTSLREGIARVLPQAGAVGKPVVTFDLDGAPEIIKDGVSGYLVRPLDVHAIAERTIELLRDPASRARCGAAGRAFAAEHYSVDRMVERINELYLELVAARQPPPSSADGLPLSAASSTNTSRQDDTY